MLLEDEKIKFLQRNAAFRDAVASSVMHNKLYKNKNETEQNKLRVKIEWFKLLKDYSSKYENGNKDWKHYLKDVESLHKNMNCESLIGTVDFKISHAQKSLSLYLKHLWCMGQIPEPPCCPIDSIVLSAASIKGAWTKIISPEEFKKVFLKVKNFAENQQMTIAVWELTAFNEMQN